MKQGFVLCFYFLFAIFGNKRGGICWKLSPFTRHWYVCRVINVWIIYTVIYTVYPRNDQYNMFCFCLVFDPQYFDKRSSCLHTTQSFRENWKIIASYQVDLTDFTKDLSGRQPPFEAHAACTVDGVKKQNIRVLTFEGLINFRLTALMVSFFLISLFDDWRLLFRPFDYCWLDRKSVV